MYNISQKIPKAKAKTFPVVIFFAVGILETKGGDTMQMKSWVITMGVGAAAGAVAVMMLPRQNPARKLASKAAMSVEDAVCQVSNKISKDMTH